MARRGLIGVLLLGMATGCGTSSRPADAISHEPGSEHGNTPAASAIRLGAGDKLGWSLRHGDQRTARVRAEEARDRAYASHPNDY